MKSDELVAGKFSLCQAFFFFLKKFFGCKFYEKSFAV